MKCANTKRPEAFSGRFVVLGQAATGDAGRSDAVASGRSTRVAPRRGYLLAIRFGLAALLRCAMGRLSSGAGDGCRVRRCGGELESASE